MKIMKIYFLLNFEITFETFDEFIAVIYRDFN